MPDGFTPVTVNLLDRYEEYFARTPRRAADFTATNIWGWAGHYGLGLGFRRNLCWVCQTRPEVRFWAPVGDWNGEDWEACPEISAGVTLHRVPEDLADLLQARLDPGRTGRITQEESRGQWEYLYSREELATLRGNRFHRKKNHVNAFFRQYGEDYRSLNVRDNPRSIDDVLALQEDWCRWRDCEHSPALQAENDAIFRVVGNWARFRNLRGGALYVDGVMVAFAIGEPLDHDTLVVHFEKVQPDYRGVYQAINNTFIRYEGEGFSFVNREQDMDEEGLRQDKETYNPVGFLKKSRLVIGRREC
jgi:hypothetical protein